MTQNAQTQTSTVAPEYHYPIPPWHADIVNGIVLGDYTQRLGVPGRITQVILSFIPGVGSVCAIRDFFGCRRKKDHIGAALNAIAFIPFFGGFPKTIAAVRALGAASQTVLAGHGALQEFHAQRAERSTISMPHSTDHPAPPVGH